jgi:phospholipase C
MTDQLQQIEHIVVLMLENRSFDHMLGYLSLEGGRQDVDGLTGNESNLDDDGNEHKVQRMASPTVMEQDPCHEWDCVEEQLDDQNGGFVTSYAKHVTQHPELVMHYFNAQDVPVYDHLAREYTICDRWFCSVPGATQPNRAYGLAGTSDGRKENFSAAELGLGGGGFKAKTIFEMLPNNVSWRYYSHDVAGLRFFKKFKASVVPQIDKIDKFLDAAQQGSLANVVFIDPDFSKSVYPGAPNDDHPTHDIRHGQNLVSRVYNALLTGGNSLWSKTLLVVTYDEHGGFYDHVSPRDFTPADGNGAEFQQYGPRVPAFIVSPWAARGKAYGSRSHGLQSTRVVFDHTSILRTILRRFCTPQGGATPDMTARVDAANDLGALLTEAQARTDFTTAPTIRNVPESLKDKFFLDAPESEFEEQMLALAGQAMANGVPPGNL